MFLQVPQRGWDRYFCLHFGLKRVFLYNISFNSNYYFFQMADAEGAANGAGLGGSFAEKAVSE